MSSNNNIRKRSLPEWMKSTSQSSSSKLSPNRKGQGPSYPPISVKKVKIFPKLVEQSVILTDDQDITGAAGDFSDDKQNDHTMERLEKPGPSSTLISPSSLDESDPELDDVFLTVEDLTRVAQEVIHEELEKQRISHSAQKHTLS